MWSLKVLSRFGQLRLGATHCACPSPEVAYWLFSPTSGPVPQAAWLAVIQAGGTLSKGALVAPSVTAWNGLDRI